MGVWSTMIQPFIGGWQSMMYAARRQFEDPSTAHQQSMFVQRISSYQLLWAYYNNSMFDKTARFLNSGSWQNSLFWPASGGWQVYKSNYNLYRNIRMVYNPCTRLVDFYAGQVYPGLLSEDGDKLPDGVPLAIPFSQDTEPELKDAIAQFWAWSNWQAKKAVLVRFGAALGNVLVEAIDDVERGKVTAEIQWPGFVRDLELDAAGNVKSYSLEYAVWNLDEGSYVYRKDVDQDQICYYRNNEPFDYGYGAILENPYGFTPAVWVKHIDVGSDYGSPAIAGSFGKIDELNNLASHAHDQIHKVIGAPAVIWSDAPVTKLFGADANKSRGTTSDFEKPAQEQENILLLKGPAGGSVSSLAGELSLSDTAIYMDRLLAEIENDHPELSFYQKLRDMSTLTGPAASRIAGDVAGRVIDAQAQYDQACISLFRMIVAIGGFRANSGSWGTLNRQQQKFKPFNLDSYQRGDLDMSIMPRPLLVPTKTEIAQEKQAIWTGVGLAVQQAGVPVEVVLKDEGWTDDQLKQLGQAKVEQIQRDQILASEDTIPQVAQ